MANGPPDVDLIITGDRVIDPFSGLDGPAQIHVTNGKIVSVSDDMSVKSASRHVDATGMIVCPGLIDMHVHVYEYTNPTKKRQKTTPTKLGKKKEKKKEEQKKHFFFLKQTKGINVKIIEESPPKVTPMKSP